MIVGYSIGRQQPGRGRRVIRRVILPNSRWSFPGLARPTMASIERSFPCAILGLVNARKAIVALDDDEKQSLPVLPNRVTSSYSIYDWPGIPSQATVWPVIRRVILPNSRWSFPGSARLSLRC
jgi:hypothetical protein